MWLKDNRGRGIVLFRCWLTGVNWLRATGRRKHHRYRVLGKRRTTGYWTDSGLVWWYTRGGDVETGLHTKHYPEKCEKWYRGYAGKAVLVRLAEREKACYMFEARMLAQQYVLCRVLERGLIADLERVEEFRPKKEVETVTNVLRRFKISINHLCGMEDYIRIVDGSHECVKVERTRSTLGGGRNRRAVSKNAYDGMYVVFTLLTSRHGGFFADMIDTTGIYVTVTEHMIRGFTGSRLGETGKYYEYVAPAHPTDDNLTRIYWMCMESSLVLPTTAVVRFGGHWEYDVELFGFLVRAKRLEQGGKMRYLHVESGVQEYNQLGEYGYETELMKRHKEEGAKLANWDVFMRNHPFERNTVVGTIPSIMEIDLKGRRREELVNNMYNALSEGTKMEDVYCKIPVLLLLKKECDEIYEDDTGKESRRMWQGVKE
ncbi:hypothetical protein FGB62_100g09 [Gracilaria domingensis]|nr:hypothetical protein FGB62_100g09 [Gracilaria domingensis]